MLYIIANPAASCGAARKRVNYVWKSLKAKNVPFRLFRTKKAGDARQLAKKISEGHDKKSGTCDIVVLGGDGTINEVLNGITSFENVRFAVCPVGSGNDMARGLGVLDLEIDEVIDRIANGQTIRQMDLCTVDLTDENGNKAFRRFGVSSGMGFDAAVCVELENSPLKGTLNKFKLGSVGYTVVAVKQIVGAPKAKAKIEGSEKKIELDKVLFSSVMNQMYEGGGFKLAPDSTYDDGLFNVLVVGDIPVIKEITSLLKAKRGEHYGIDGIYNFTDDKIVIESEKPLYVHTDGEVLGQFVRAEYGMMKGVLTLIV